MRKLYSLFALLVCLSLAVPALAAPCRDPRTVSVAGPTLETAVSLFGGAALMRDVDALAEGAPVPQALTEGALLLGYGRHLLPGTDGDPNDGAETVDAAALSALLPGLFAGAADVPVTPSCPCITRTGDTLVFDVTDVDVESATGAYIFSSWQDGARVTVLADLYSAIAYFGEDMDAIPEDCVTWMRTAQLVLEESEVSPLGYRLVSLAAYPEWLDGTVSEWTMTLGEDYEVSLPSFLSLASSEDGVDLYVADGVSAQLTIQTLPATGADPLAAARAEYAAAYPDAAIVMEPALSYFTAETDGAYALYICPEASGTLRVLTLTFPGERQYEFSFYGEIIRNSFWCEGMGLG